MAMLDWREIPGNERAFRRLRELVQQGEAVAFIGAGASAGLYPLWGGLIQRLAEEAESRSGATPTERDAWLVRVREYPDQVVRSIKAKLGEGTYAELLREIFRPKAGQDSNRFTPIHGLLLRARFQGYITTNFDAGLLEARAALRPESPVTGYGTWKDPSAVYGWDTGDIFKDEPCPVLFAHGVYERPDTVVLGTGEYREAYKTGAFHRLFLNLWGQRHLAFVGFSFADAWVRFVANDVLMTLGTRQASPRHIALIGLREKADDAGFARELFADQYDAAALFYPVVQRADGGEDHGALQSILQDDGPARIRTSNGCARAGAGIGSD
jgi:hypothetical protein